MSLQYNKRETSLTFKLPSIFLLFGKFMAAGVNGVIGAFAPSLVGTAGALACAIVTTPYPSTGEAIVRASTLNTKDATSPSVQVCICFVCLGFFKLH